MSATDQQQALLDRLAKRRPDLTPEELARRVLTEVWPIAAPTAGVKTLQEEIVDAIGATSGGSTELKR